jgi:DNA-binding CsgD family transcriptional regulator
MSGGKIQPADPLVEPLTGRERDILTLLAQEHSAPEIAQSLTLAVSSVKWYIQQVYGKLGVNSKRQAITRARELGLVAVSAVASPPGSLVSQAGPLGPERTSSVPDSGTVTFLFSDIEGSTQLLERLREP